MTFSLLPLPAFITVPMGKPLPPPGLLAAVVLAVLAVASSPRVQAQDITISEFMADNRSTLADEDGDYSDWIELHNSGKDKANLDGYFLTDDADNLDQWNFPAVSVPAGGYIVVFASGKNRASAGAELHTNFKLKAGGEFLGLTRPGSQEPDSA